MITSWPVVDDDGVTAVIVGALSWTVASAFEDTAEVAAA